MLRLMLNRALRICFIGIILTLFSSPTFAQDPLAQIDYLKRENVSERLEGLGNDLMGDSIDLNTGALFFQHTDVSIPGNSGLEVAIRRTRTPDFPFPHLETATSTALKEHYDGGLEKSSPFSDWKLEIPQISMTVPLPLNNRGEVGAPPKASTFERDICSVGGLSLSIATVEAPKRLTNAGHILLEGGGIADGQVFERDAASNGVELMIPGQGSKKWLYNQKEGLWPSNVDMVTKDFWTLSCGSTTDNSITVKSPQGTTYIFDQYHVRPAIAVKASGVYLLEKTGAGDPLGWNTALPRVNAALQVSQIRDVNGNWVKYTYDDKGWLTKIFSNDDRIIDVSYNTSGHISKITANGRTWDYGYANSQSGGVELLKTVTRPDGHKWTFNFTPHSVTANSEVDCEVPNVSWEMTHPYGTKGKFVFAETKHWANRTQRTQSCISGKPLQTISYYEIMSVIEKTLSQDSSPDSTWHFNYSELESSKYRNSKWGEIIDPSGVRTRSTYSNANTMELETEVFDVGQTTPMLTTSYTYHYEDAVGETWLDHNSSSKGRYSRPVNRIKTVTKQDGDTFTSDTSYNMDQSLADYSYGFPVSRRSYSNVHSAPRGIDIEYEHKTTNVWILGLPKRTYEVSTSGARRETASAEYSSLGLKTSQTRYGLTGSIYTYHADGTIESVTDALQRRTEASNWYRGTPQLIKSAVGTPDEIQTKQNVDYNGWITSKTDAKGNVTSYDHDNMGRLKLINPPGAWDNTVIDYTFPSAGGALQTITKGQGKTTVTYDSMFRPRLEQTQALDEAWSSYVNTEYDRLGRATFTSQPSSNPSETKGVNTTYDGLGRVYDVTENVAPFAKTKHRYLSQHRYIMTDPSGAQTQYNSYGYGGPGNKDYRAITRRSGATYQQTYMFQDAYGQMTRLRQHGNHDGYPVNKSQYFYYDSNQRVCRHYVPEHGATKYEYDAAGQMTAYAKGQGNSGCGTVPNVIDKVSLTYDDLGRVLETNFADENTPDITKIYDANGNVEHVNRGDGKNAINWTYAYNNLNMLTSEQLDVDDREYDIAYAYNPSGYLIQKTQPYNRVIDYTVDGLGRMLGVANDNTPLASNVNYHASGGVHQMTYGNGHFFSQVLNDRLLPERVLSYKASIKAIDQTLGYDARGNITSILDGAVSGNNRTYSYDGLGYLKTASGPWGAGSYKYDSLGNLREKKLGSRTVRFTYDVRNRLTQSIDTGTSGLRVLGHDARGNVTSLGNLAFEYDKSDQPTAVTGTANGIGTANGTYAYDGNLKRVRSIMSADGGGAKIIYNIYDASGALILVDKATDRKVNSYVSGPTGTLARIQNIVNQRTGTHSADDVTYMHPNHLGSAVAGTNKFGGVRWREQYTPFGEELQTVDWNDDLDGFTGHIKDKATGLNYMQARYYDPVIGRFLSIDPVTFMDTGNPGQFNRYAYTWNDPINAFDPNGEHPVIAVVPVAVACAATPLCRAGVGAGVGAVSGAASSIGVQAFDGKEGIDWGVVGTSTIKGGTVGGVGGLTLSPKAAILAAAGIGAVDGALNSDANTKTGVAIDAATTASVDALTTGLGGAIGNEFGSELAGQAVGIGAAIGISQGANTVNAVQDAVGAIGPTYQNIKEDVKGLIDQATNPPREFRDYD